MPFLSDVEPVIANPVKSGQPAIDLVPTFVLVAGPEPVHRPGEHHAHLAVRKFKDFIKALPHRHLPCPQHLVAVDRVLKFLQRGGIVVRVDHFEQEASGDPGVGQSRK